MLKIIGKNVVKVGHQFDYELENGVLLHEQEWNGECYTVREDGVETRYFPIYSEEENENGGFDIIGFED